MPSASTVTGEFTWKKDARFPVKPWGVYPEIDWSLNTTVSPKACNPPARARSATNIAIFFMRTFRGLGGVDLAHLLPAPLHTFVRCYMHFYLQTSRVVSY